MVAVIVMPTCGLPPILARADAVLALAAEYPYRALDMEHMRA